MSSWASDMKAANSLFSTFIAEISSELKGRLISTELEGGRLADIFDKYAGIDAVHVWGDKVRGVAVRVQWGVNYKTFTIRYRRASGAPTEFEKRVEAIRSQDGWLYPHLTIQAYADKRDGGSLLSYAVISTDDLFLYLASNVVDRFIVGKKGKIPGTCITYNTCPEGNTFLIVRFGDLDKANIRHIVRDFETDTMSALNSRQQRLGVEYATS